MEGVVKELLEQDVCLISEWKNVQIEEMNIQKDHIHLVVSIPPKLFISACMGILKGKTAMKLFKSYPQLKKKPYWGNHFWAPGYFVNTIGMDEELIKRYVKYQEEEEKKQENQNRDYHLF